MDKSKYIPDKMSDEDLDDILVGSGNQRVSERKLKDLKTSEGFAIGRALAALSKYKGKITKSITYNDSVLAMLDKNKDIHPTDGSIIK